MAPPLHTPDQTSFDNLCDMAPVIDGAIVTKPLIDSPSVKQILFSMDKGQELSEHCAPFSATVAVLSGQIEFTIKDTGHTQTMGPNDWLIMKPSETHRVVATEPCCFLLTLLKK